MDYLIPWLRLETKIEPFYPKTGRGRQLFEEIKGHLNDHVLLLREGSIADATIIAAPSSSKNREKARDLEMHQTKKGNQWHFGMKLHIR